MRYFTAWMVLAMILSSCQAEINNYKKKEKHALFKNKKELYNFTTWDKVPNEISEVEKISYPIPINEALGMIKNDYNETKIIAKVKNLKFEIIPYKKEDNEKDVEYIAKVLKCYKGVCPQTIHYRISYEINDKINIKNNTPAIVLLTEYNNTLYLNDQFVYFKARRKLEIELEKLSKK